VFGYPKVYISGYTFEEFGISLYNYCKYFKDQHMGACKVSCQIRWNRHKAILALEWLIYSKNDTENV